jgi:xylulose-5-phosphate/fructose-6-phosphate phosphoketolase
MNEPLKRKEMEAINAYWRAANYLSVGQIYLYDNPLLKEPLKLEHIKPRLLGHWETTPGLNFIYAHLNRLIKQHALNMIYIATNEDLMIARHTYKVISGKQLSG